MTFLISTGSISLTNYWLGSTKGWGTSKQFKEILVICDVLVLRVTVILLKSLFSKMWYNLRRKPVHQGVWVKYNQD